MAIYIKGMEMPTACENCLLSYWTGTRTWRCVPQDRKYSEHKGDNGSIRQEGCPLISEVSEPHGMSDLTREEAIQVLQTALTSPFIYGEYADAIDKAIEALSSDAIAKAYNQGFVEGSVNATANSNYVCPRCGEKMERKEGGDTE